MRTTEAAGPKQLPPTSYLRGYVKMDVSAACLNWRFASSKNPIYILFLYLTSTTSPLILKTTFIISYIFPAFSFTHWIFLVYRLCASICLISIMYVSTLLAPFDAWYLASYYKQQSHLVVWNFLYFTYIRSRFNIGTAVPLLRIISQNYKTMPSFSCTIDGNYRVITLVFL